MHIQGDGNYFSVTVDANSEEEAKQIADETPWDKDPEVVGTTLIACEEVVV